MRKFKLNFRNKISTKLPLQCNSLKVKRFRNKNDDKKMIPQTLRSNEFMKKKSYFENKKNNINKKN